MLGFIQRWGMQGECKFHLFVSNVFVSDQGNKDGSAMSYSRDEKIPLRSSVSCLKVENVL